jgi:hypothetical protein
LLGITYLAYIVGAVPSEAETVFSQLARTIYNSRGILYLAVISSTTIILVMAANTAFADFPRLSALVGADGFLPRQLAYRGSRLVYSRGIGALAIFASLLIVGFNASVTKLIPLYAIGVFLSFTLSQAGMARRWFKSGMLGSGQTIQERGSLLGHDDSWKVKMLVNGFGAFTTFVVMIVFAVTKFADGAWVIILIIPILVMIFMGIHKHYIRLARKLSLEDYGAPPRIARHRVVIPISGVHRGTVAALRYAKTLSDDITAVHVSLDDEEVKKVQAKWQVWGDGVRLVVIESPYRLFLEPVLQYIESVRDQMQANEILTIVVPQFVPKNWWTNALHTQTAFTMRMALLFKPGIVVTDVPYQVE